jgi:flagellar motor switch protein FliN
MSNSNRAERLPFWKSLLKLETAVCVSIAQRSMPVERLVNLAPGAILQFDKSCDSPLSLEVNGIPIAECEVVKSGDRFGVKIGSVNYKPDTWISLTKSKSS